MRPPPSGFPPPPPPILRDRRAPTRSLPEQSGGSALNSVPSRSSPGRDAGDGHESMIIVASGLAAVFVLSASSVCVVVVTETTPLGQAGWSPRISGRGSGTNRCAPVPARWAGTPAIPSVDTSTTSSSAAERRVDPATGVEGCPGGASRSSRVRAKPSRQPVHRTQALVRVLGSAGTCRLARRRLNSWRVRAWYAVFGQCAVPPFWPVS